MAGIPKVIAQEVELLPKAAAMGSERQIGKPIMGGPMK